MIKKILISLILPLFVLTACQSQEMVDTTQAQKNKIEQRQADESLSTEHALNQEKITRERNFSGILNIFLTLAGIGAGGFILLTGLGGGYYTVQSIRNKASLVFGNENGQFPLIINRGIGHETIRDPNRQLDAVNTLGLPNPRQQLTAIRQRDVMPQPVPQLTDGKFQMRVTTQAQYHQMMQSIKIDPALRRMHQRGMLETVVEGTKEEKIPDAEIVIQKPTRQFNVVDQTGVRQLT